MMLSLKPWMIVPLLLGTVLLPAEEIINLDPVLVTAYPVVEQSHISIHGKTDIISESILDTLNAGDLTSALRRVPGVTISRYNPVGAYGGSDGGGLFIRGHGSGRPGADIATMIDGIPLFVGVWTHPLIDTLSVDVASSIEVMKSPQPILAGSMGFGAVNIIPKTAYLKDHHGELEGSFGHHETGLLRGEYTYLNDRFGMVLSASHRESEGHRSNANGEVDAVYGNISFALNQQWSTSLLVSLTDSWANDPESVGMALPIVENYTTQNRFYLAKTNYDSDSTHFEIKMHMEDGKGSWLQWHQPPPPPFPPQTLESITKYKNYGLKSKLSGTWSDSGSWDIGLNWDRFGGEVLEVYGLGLNNAFEPMQFEILSPHIQIGHLVELSGGDREFELNGGLRYMSHSVFNSTWVGQVGAVLKSQMMHSYFNFSDTVNYPGVYVSVFGRRAPPWNVGENWRELDAESIRHYEVGTKLLITPDFTLDLNFFIDEVDSALAFVTPPPSGYILNIGEYTTKGTELLIHYHKGALSAFAGVTLLDTDEAIPNTPKWSGTVGFHLKKGPWSWVVDFQKVSEQLTYNPRFDLPHRQVDGYQLISSRIAYRIESKHSYWEFYLHGENLGNQPYEFRPGYPMPGITLTFGVKHAW